MDIKQRARKQLNWLEKALHAIPGFKGYYERELRRDSDRLLRESIARTLSLARDQLHELIQEVTRQKRLSLLSPYDEVARLLDKLINEIRYADRGYSGFFDLIKIRESELDAIYQLDVQLAEQADQFAEGFERIKAAASGEAADPTAVKELKATLKACERAFQQRLELLRGFK